MASGTELKYGNSSIKLEAGKITINNGTSTIVMDGNDIQLTGAVSVTGSFTVNGKDVGDNHKHSGVTSGDSNTGGVV